MVSEIFKIFIVWSCLLKSCLSQESSSDSPEESNNGWKSLVAWNPTDEEVKIEENTVNCECCIATSYVLHSSFESAHKNRPDTIGRLSYPDIIDITGKQANMK